MNTFEIESDDSGFWLVVRSDQYTNRYRIKDPEALYDAVRADIGPWLHERELARKTAPTPLYVDDSGYDLSDPKHENFHSVHADLWDARDGK